MESEWTLYAHPFCPHSRAAQLCLAEVDLSLTMVEEQVWTRREDFLILNPKGEIPVLVYDEKIAICSVASLCEFLLDYGFDNRTVSALWPSGWRVRAEIRRINDWFDQKFGEEVSHALAHEHVFRRQMGVQYGGGAPDTEVLRAIGQNLKSHLAYLDYLLTDSGWLVGEKMCISDLITAAHISIVDYFGLIRWGEHPTIKDWYQRVKSRPSFKPILSSKIPGVSPPKHYTELDF